MSFSRECLLHFPFPVKLWLAAETQSIAAVFWNEFGNTVYIDLYQLESYLRTTGSIFNVVRVEEFMLHVIAFDFERITNTSTITPGFQNKFFKRVDPLALKYMAVEGYNLNFPLSRKALSLPISEEMKHSGTVPFQLMDFGDFEFIFNTFQQYIFQLKSFVVALMQHDEVLKKLDVTYIPEVNSMLYCNHFHSIIIPALWYPKQRVQLAGGQIRSSLETNCLLYWEKLDDLDFPLTLKKKYVLDVPEEELMQCISDAKAVPLIEHAIDKKKRNIEKVVPKPKTENNSGKCGLGLKLTDTLTQLNLWRSKDSSEKTFSKSSKTSSADSENSIYTSYKPIVLRLASARSDEKLAKIGRLLPLCNVACKRCFTTKCTCACIQNLLK